MVRPDKLDFWFRQRCNVLFRGRHGVGKTAVIKQCFERHGLTLGETYLYFSAATLDPWVDLVGVPKERVDENGVAYLDLVRPRQFAHDQVEAIFVDEYNRCLSGDTLISLVDGRDVPVKDLVGVGHFYVYSYDTKAKRVVVGRGHSARRTGRKQSTVTVTLDNGEQVICTPDHPFLLRGGSYRAAGQLKPGDSIMPLYRRSTVNGRVAEEGTAPDGSRYEQVWQPDKPRARWEFTHRLANDYNLRSGAYLVVPDGQCHHVDKNPRNNSPENILMLGRGEHVARFHSSDGGRAAHKKHPDLCDRSFNAPEAKKKAIAKSTRTRRQSPSYKQLRSKISKRFQSSPEQVAAQAEACRVGWARGQFNHDRKLALAAGQRTYAIKFGVSLLDRGIPLTPESYNQYRNEVPGKGKSPVRFNKLLELFGSFGHYVLAVTETRRLYNHKVVAVTPSQAVDVYDITVDEYHNFALTAGVFVHNSHKKVRNAVMELIQFKSINGKVFSNLKVVWAAVNPGGDDGYDVDEIDPAQLDRFHITVDVPYAPDQQWFADRFGFHTAKHALAWWHGLPDLEKDKVSPRRLEYALTMWCAGGDLRDVVPASANVGKLTQLLAADILPTERLQQFYLARNAAEAEAFLANENNYAACTEYILGNAQRANFFLPLLTKERLSTLAATHMKVCNRMCAQAVSVPKYAETLDAIVKANQNYKLARYVRRKLEAIKTKTESEKLADLYAGCPPSDKADPYHSESPDRPWRTAHDDLRRLKVKTEQQAAALYEGLLADLPQAFVNWSDVCNALGLLNNLVTPWWAKTVMPAKLTGIVNMINHCLAELQRLTSVSTPTWHDFFKYYKGHWNTLFRYLADTNQATWVRPPHVPETKGDKA